MGLLQIPTIALKLAANIPARFTDDGCSSAPDRLFGVNLQWACRIHDHWWCTRAHPPGTMTPGWRLAGDMVLSAIVRQALSRHPLRHLIAFAYLHGPRLGRGAFDTCGSKPEGTTSEQDRLGLCRHDLPPFRQPVDGGDDDGTQRTKA